MNAPEEVVVLSVARTPFGRFGGALRNLRAVDLASSAMAEALRRSGVAASAIQAVYAGIGMIGANVVSATRQAILCGSGIPASTPSFGVDRACCSGMTALGLGFKDIRSGEIDVALCGGFESLSNTPFLWPRQRGSRPGAVNVVDPLLLRADFLDKAIARYTGEEALKHGVDRTQQDEWAMASHQKYFAAEARDYFDFERFPLEVDPATTVTRDESPRADVSLERLRELRPIYESPTVTPGNAPGLNDGSAFIVLTSQRFARAHGLNPLAIVRDYVQVADGPTSGTATPALAIRRLLERTNRTLADIAHFEINEAFAATPLVSTALLAGHDSAAAADLRSRTNPAGGAVAIGHPVGASGARIVMTLINTLRRANGGLGATAICGGFGQGDGMLIEVL